jgi:hypothetical protein
MGTNAKVIAQPNWNGEFSPRISFSGHIASFGNGGICIKESIGQGVQNRVSILYAYTWAHVIYIPVTMLATIPHDGQETLNNIFVGHEDLLILSRDECAEKPHTEQDSRPDIGRIST